MTTVAVTGSTGFLGSALVRNLAAQGFDIVALARASADRRPLSDLNITWVEGDVTEPDSLSGFAEGADWLVHAAGMLGQAGVPEHVYQRLHVDGTRNVLKVAGHCQRILLVSSPGVLGPIKEGPAADEKRALAPSNPYERSKADAEKVALAFAREGLPIIIGRPEFVYGPGDRHVLGLFRAVQQGRFFYVSGGTNSCHPTFIDDAVDGLLRGLGDGSPGEIYHIAGPRPVTFRELAETMARALGVAAPRYSLPRPVALAGALMLETAAKSVGKTAPLSRNGVAFFSEDRRFSYQKAETELGYRPQVGLQEGMELTVKWYKRHGLL